MTLDKTIRIGVDVGGTNTDAVAIDVALAEQGDPHRGVLTYHKTPTTPDATSGIETAIRAVLSSSSSSSSSSSCPGTQIINPARIASVTVGTTHFINSVVERDARRLRPVAVLRLSRSFLREVPPFADFPPDLAALLNGYCGLVDGGLHIDGSQEAPINEAQVVRACAEIRKRRLTAVVIAGVFSPIDETFQQETRVRDIVLRELGGASNLDPPTRRRRQQQQVDVVCSHEVANIGFLERENASILNAAILAYARTTVRRFRRAMQRLQLACPLFLTQNDGTILDAAAAARIPIRTFSSGATNSMRGAAYLAGLDHPPSPSPPSEGGATARGGGGGGGGRKSSGAIVVDMGGTTSDVGVLLPSGLPRQASAYVTVAGVRVNYSMPHLHSIGLGGGSLVHQDHDDDDDDDDDKQGAKGKAKGKGKVRVGPASVGHLLTDEALVFGGSTCTASDIAVAFSQQQQQTGDRILMGDASKVQHLSPQFVQAARDRIKALLDGAIDVIKTSPDPMPVLLVGGGAVLAPAQIAGASEVIRPPFHDVANAVGAAISRVGGSVDIVQNTSQQTEAQAIQYAKDLAVQRALAAGALASSIAIAEVESMPLQYVAHQVRTLVKAVGDIDFRASAVWDEAGEEENKHLDLADMDDDDDDAVEEEEEEEEEAPKNLGVHNTTAIETTPVDPFTYRPTIATHPTTGVPEWLLTETDLAWLADGCYVLGCAGGGSPAASLLQLRGMLRDMLRDGEPLSHHNTIRIIDAAALRDDALIYWGGHMGSPAVSVERLQSIETVQAFEVLMDYLGHHPSDLDAVMGLEIGGANGLEPFLVGSPRFFAVPVIDGDWMGRAYPTYWQTTLAVHAPGELVPCAIDAGDGTSLVMTRAPTDEIVDRALRASCAEMGSRVGMAARPTATAQVRRYGVLRTCSLAWRVGRAMARCEAGHRLARVAEAIIAEAGGATAAKVLFRGKIVAVERRLVKGHSYGTVHIAAFGGGGGDGNGDVNDDDDADVDDDKATAALATGGTLQIPFKNENIYAEHTAADGTTRRILASVPDLIAVLDNGSGRALGVPEFKYGYRVTVIGITCSPRWTEVPAGLDIGGPKAFGYEDIRYRPLGTYVEPRSVIEEYGP